MKYLIFLILLFPIFAIAQPQKKIEQCIKLYEEDPQKAAAKLKKLLDKAGKESNPEAWDIYVEMKENIYNMKLQEVGGSFEYFVLQQKFDNISKKVDSVIANPGELTEQQLRMLKQEAELQQNMIDQEAYDLYADDYESYIYALREASLKSVSMRSDLNLRGMYFTSDPDTMNADTAEIRYFGQAYDLINAGQFEEGRVILDSIVKIYPNSYSVNMTYYLYYQYKEQLDSAKMKLQKVIELFPTEIEPRENLAKIYFGEGNTYRAKEQILELVTLYPGQDLKGYLREVLFVEDKKLNEKRIVRPVFPNQIGYPAQSARGHWKDYQEAMLKVAAFTNEYGIIKENDVTQETYLEIYSWKRMLDKNKDKKPAELSFAYEMQEKGLLDCYVFFSNYHIDFAAQAEHFSQFEENRERMKNFIMKYLVELAD